MNSALRNEKNSTSKKIESLGLPERQRSRALADLALADTLVGAFIAASKFLHLR